MEAMALRHWISSTPAELLVASVWQGLLLTVFAWSALRLAVRLRASTRFTLWLIVFLLVALLPCFAIVRGMWATPGLPGTTSASGFALHIGIAWAFAIEAVWGFCSLFSLIRLGLGVRQMMRLRASSTLLPYCSLDATLQTIVARPRSVSVEVRLSRNAQAPSVIGFLRPAIVVPSALWRELAPGNLQQILLHEMAHLQRGDDWTNLLQKLLRALCPLNPALLWAERQLCREREQACDDAVLDAAGNGRAYATCLTDLAAHKFVRRTAMLAVGFAFGLWKSPSELAERVDNILHRRPGLHPAVARGLVAVTLVASLAGGLGLQFFPRLITFADKTTIAAEAAPQWATRAAASRARAYPAEVLANQKSLYQEAAFHPQVKQGTTPAIAPAKHNKSSRCTAKNHPLLRFIAVPTFDEQSPTGIRWVLFTVQVKQARSVAVPIDLRNLTTPNNWIAFSI